MGIKEQLGLVRKNWLLVLILLVLIFIGPGLFSETGSLRNLSGFNDQSAVSGIATVESSEFFPGSGGDFVPEIEERIKTVFASLSIRVERGEFASADKFVRERVEKVGGLLLNENIYTTGQGLSESKHASYSVRVPIEEYDLFVDELGEIGEIERLTENVDDITGRVTNLEIEFEAEFNRLERYKELYENSVSVEEKLLLSDRIFNQERRIAYLEESLKNQGQRADYANLQVSLDEEESDLAGIKVINLKEIIRSFIDSLSSLIKLIFWILPWALVIWVIWFIWKKSRK